VPACDQIDPAVGNNTHAAQRAHFTGINTGNRKTVPILTHFRPGQGEDLNRHAKLERAQPVIGNGNDKRVGRARIGRGWHDLDDIWQSCQLQSPCFLSYLSVASAMEIRG
jgi:hypothetical protein